MTGTETDTQDVLRRRELVFLVIVLLTATLMRTWRLDAIPPGLTHDEAGHGHDAIAILEGARPIYQTVGYGREPLYDYWVAGLMAIAGRTREVLRFSAVPLGLVTLLTTFAWARAAYDGTVALAATALQTVAFWSLAVSRQALRSSLLPVVFTAAIFFFWHSIYPTRRRLSPWRLGIFSLLVGATFYTYVPARVLWILFPIFLAYLAIFHRRTFQRVSAPILAAVGAGLLMGVPLFVFLKRHPGAEQRLAMLDAPLRALLAGDPSVVLNRAGRFLAGLTIPGRGDSFLAYTIPGRPIFGLLTGVLFLIGVGLCVVRWREPKNAFSLLWFALGVSPSLVTGPAASTTRSVAALPVIFLFPAIAVVSGARWASERWGSVASWVIGLAAGGLLLGVGGVTIQDYFVTWGESPHTRAAYQHTLVELAAYLDSQPEDGVVGISTDQPLAPHDPYVFQLSLKRRDLSVRWFDARRAIVVPERARARLVIPSSATPPPILAELPGLQCMERVQMRTDDLDPWFEVFEWQPRMTRAEVTERMDDSANVSGEAVLSEEGGRTSLGLPATFGGALELLGYDLLTPVVGVEEIQLLTVWKATNPDAIKAADPADVEDEPVVFVHALDGEGALLAQDDRLDAPVWSWEEGDMILQIHRLALPPDPDHGPPTLSLGVYRRTDMRRLPVTIKDKVVGDSLLLPTVRVEG